MAIAGTIEDFYANADLQRTLIVTGGLSGGGIQLPTNPDPNTLANMLAAQIPTSVGGVLGGAVAKIGVAELEQFACNLFPSLCNNGSSLMAQTTAPKAGLISGACPPGRVVRHVSLGRDICIKKPRMNPLNPKALNRAVRRLAGFQNFATRTEKAIRHSFIKAGVRPTARRGGACTTCRKKTCGGC